MRRGYYIDDISDMLTFPIAEMAGADAGGKEELDIEIEAESGKRYAEKQGSRRIWKLPFLLRTPALYAFFEELHDAVGGQTVPFYFVLDAAASPHDVFQVRKEKDFRPVPLDRFIRINGQTYQAHRYTLELTQEIDSDLTILE